MRTSLSALVIPAMERELAEECGIPRSAIERTIIIGYARLLHRGGKPEYFGVSIVDFSTDRMWVAISERIFTHNHDYWHLDCFSTEQMLADGLNKLIHLRRNSSCSILLVLNLKVFLDYLESHSSKFMFLIDSE